MTYIWNDLAEDQELTSVTGEPVSRTEIVKYQGASGDFDAAHHHDEHAQAYGFPGVFSLGMLHAGQLNNYANGFFGRHNIRKYGMRFCDVIYPDDVLTFGGKIVKKYQENGQNKVDLELSCLKENGRAAVQAWATYIVEK